MSPLHRYMVMHPPATHLELKQQSLRFFTLQTREKVASVVEQLGAKGGGRAAHLLPMCR